MPADEAYAAWLHEVLLCGLPEMIDGNLRGLDKVFAECTWTSVRAFLAQRLCDRDGGFVAARSRCFCFFNCQVRTVLILFLSNQMLFFDYNLYQ